MALLREDPGAGVEEESDVVVLGGSGEASSSSAAAADRTVWCLLLRGRRMLDTSVPTPLLPLPLPLLLLLLLLLLHSSILPVTVATEAEMTKLGSRMMRSAMCERGAPGGPRRQRYFRPSSSFRWST